MTSSSSRPVAFVRGRVVDVARHGHLEESRVLVRGERVAEVGPPGTVALPDDAIVHDLEGAFLVPGLIDAHLHAHDRWTASLALAHGVTTICDPATWDSSPGPTAHEALPGPAILAAALPLDCPPGTWPHSVFVSNESQVRTAVRRQAAAGFRFVKLYSGLPPELVRAGVEEAHACGMRAIGDLVATSWSDAAKCGIDFLSHAIPLHPALLPANARDDYVHDIGNRLAHPYYRWIELADFNGPEIKAMVRLLRDCQVAVVPTLVAVEAALFSGLPSWRDELQPLVTRTPSPARLMHGPPDTTRRPADFDTRAAAAWPRILEFVSLLHGEGVRVLAGTDAPRPWVVPGASLVRELGLLVRAGMGPEQALRSATLASAAALGLDGSAGAIAPGFRADFVVLRDNPHSSVQALDSVRAVVLGGRIASGDLALPGDSSSGSVGEARPRP